MDCLRLAGLFLIAAAATLSVSSSRAQTADSQPALPYPAKPLPPDSVLPYPTKILPETQDFSPLSGKGVVSLTQFIAYISPEQMSAADKELTAKMRPEIRDAAELSGIDFDKESWTYRQLNCTAASHHLFLLFKSDGGAGNVSLFSASIPRNGNGRLRIIPVERRGFSLFTPAPANSFAIAAYNRIRDEEQANPPADWLAASLCYSALTAPSGQVVLMPTDRTDAGFPLFFPPSIELGQSGAQTVRFINVAMGSMPMQWALTFAAQGQLEKVEHLPAPVYATRILPKN